MKVSRNKVTVSKENYTIKGDFIKLGEFYDLYSPLVFIRGLLHEADENPDEAPMNLMVSYEKEILNVNEEE